MKRILCLLAVFSLGACTKAEQPPQPAAKEARAALKERKEVIARMKDEAARMRRYPDPRQHALVMALRNAADALATIAPQGRADDRIDNIRQYAEKIEGEPPNSKQHAQYARSALLEAAQAVSEARPEGLRAEGWSRTLKARAEAIDEKQPLTQQRDELASAIDDLADAVNDLAQAPVRPGEERGSRGTK